ncbi:MAG: thiamine phosphate synthase [Lachnospiraceae bacterium]|nr:thiamine phosphate synthase [Lachnospiraceae bacterium]
MSFKGLEKALALYAVTDRSWLEFSECTDDKGRKIRLKRDNILTLPQACEQAIKGGVTMIQLRNKEFGTGIANRDRHEALEIRDICRKYSVPFVIDDDAELAYETGADGVHLGLDDTDLTEARRLLGDEAIIGATAHNVEEAKAAEAAGADYLGCGAVFPTSTKAVKNRLTYEELSRITASVKIPVVAIAGITADNVIKLKGSGIAGAATVSGIFAAADIEKEAIRFKKILEEML